MKEYFKNIFKFLINKDVSAITIANIIGSVIGVFFWLVLAKITEIEEYGEISYLIALASIGSTISMIGGSNAIVVYSAKEIKIKKTIFFISIMVGICTAIVFSLFFQSFQIGFFIIAFIIFVLSISELLGRKLYGLYSKYFILQKILLFIFAIPSYYLFGIEGVLVGYALSYLILLKETVRLVKSEEIIFKMTKPQLKFILNNYGRELAAVFSNQTDKLIIVPLFGFAFLANYHLGMQALIILTIMPSIIFQYTLSQESSGNSQKQIKKTAIILAVFMSMLVIFLSPIVIPIIFPKFIEAVVLIQIMSIAIIPRTISFMSFSKILGMQKSKPIIIGACIFLLIQIPSIFILGDHIGINGIAISFVLGEIAQALFLILYEKKFIDIT